jgi:hypothetical protein
MAKEENQLDKGLAWHAVECRSYRLVMSKNGSANFHKRGHGEARVNRNSKKVYCRLDVEFMLWFGLFLWDGREKKRWLFYRPRITPGKKGVKNGGKKHTGSLRLSIFRRFFLNPRGHGVWTMIGLMNECYEERQE